MKNKKLVSKIVVKPRSAEAFVVKKGQLIRVIDIEGKQVSDFIAFNLRDFNERLSCSTTRGELGKIRVSRGDKLYTNIHNVIFTITEDTVGGAHDFGIFGTCHRGSYVRYGELPPRDGCVELLRKVVSGWNIQKGLMPDSTFNIFMVQEDYNSERVFAEPKTKPGDYIEIRAEMDCLVALTSCPNDIDPKINGGKITPIGVEIYEQAVIA